MSLHSFGTPAIAFASALLALWSGSGEGHPVGGDLPLSQDPAPQASQPIDPAEGQRVFRHETFGDEKFWTETLRLHEVIQSSLSPKQALALGLKVDAEAIPAKLAAAIREGSVDLSDPQTTLALLELDAVVGVKGKVETSADASKKLTSVGITCALCHSTVDDSFAPGIGRRLDGWPNRDLDVGAIVATSPALTADQKGVYQSWGKGKYDPRYNIDGLSTPLVLPPAYGLAKVKNETVTADGPISYWNAYVAVTQMHGLGTFRDDRLGIDVRNTPDLVTPLLPALRDYQLSLETPTPPADSFDAAAAKRGRIVFASTCQKCHVDVSGTDNNSGVLHAPADTGMDGAYAARTLNKAYRTTPLRGLWQHPPYFHDGSADTLEAVVAHYQRVLDLELSVEQRADLVQFLKSL